GSGARRGAQAARLRAAPAAPAARGARAGALPAHDVGGASAAHGRDAPRPRHRDRRGAVGGPHPPQRADPLRAEPHLRACQRWPDRRHHPDLPRRGAAGARQRAPRHGRADGATAGAPRRGHHRGHLRHRRQRHPRRPRRRQSDGARAVDADQPPRPGPGMSDRLDALDYYTLLGVADDASLAEINRGFRAFARRFHPDRHAEAPPERIERALRIYRRGSEAYRVLSEPDSRRDYDAALSLGPLRLDEDALAALRPRAVAPAQAAILSLEARAYLDDAARRVARGDKAGALRAPQAADRAEPGNP